MILMELPFFQSIIQQSDGVSGFSGVSCWAAGGVNWLRGRGAKHWDFSEEVDAETVDANTIGSLNESPSRNEIKVKSLAIVKLNGDVNVNADSKKINLLIDFSKSCIALHKRDVIILYNQNKHFVRTPIELSLSANQRMRERIIRIKTKAPSGWNMINFKSIYLNISIDILLELADDYIYWLNHELNWTWSEGK